MIRKKDLFVRMEKLEKRIAILETREETEIKIGERDYIYSDQRFYPVHNGKVSIFKPVSEVVKMLLAYLDLKYIHQEENCFLIGKLKEKKK